MNASGSVSLREGGSVCPGGKRPATGSSAVRQETATQEHGEQQSEEGAMRMKLVLAALLMLASGGVSVAQKFPDRAVRIIVPNPPGGSNDAAARIVAQGLTNLLW